MFLGRVRPSRWRRLSARVSPRVQQRLVKQLVEVWEFSRKGELFLEFLEPRMMEQLVDVQKMVVELAVSSGGAGSFGPERVIRPAPPLQQLQIQLWQRAAYRDCEVQVPNSRYSCRLNSHR